MKQKVMHRGMRQEVYASTDSLDHTNISCRVLGWEEVGPATARLPFKAAHLSCNEVRFSVTHYVGGTILNPNEKKDEFGQGTPVTSRNELYLIPELNLDVTALFKGPAGEATLVLDAPGRWTFTRPADQNRSTATILLSPELVKGLRPG
jgi:hypothetical protein